MGLNDSGGWDQGSGEVEIRSKRIDDVPLLVYQQRKMGIPEVLNRAVEPHSNRQGLSVGWLTMSWLSYILSEGDIG